MNLALNPFDRGRKPEVVERIEISDRVQRFIEVYQGWKKFLDCFEVSEEDFEESFDRALDAYSVEPFTAGEVMVLSDHLSSNPEIYSGPLINSLIRRAKKNDFTFELLINNPLHSLCSKLSSVNLIVKGDVGDFFGSESKFCCVYLHGSAKDNFADTSEGSHYYVDGSIGNKFANSAYRCYFEVKGKIEPITSFDSAYDNTLQVYDAELNKAMFIVHNREGSSNKVSKK